MFDYFGVLAIVAVGIGCGFLCRLAWRAKPRPVKWIGASLAGLLTLTALAVLIVVLVGYWKLNRSYDNPPSTIAVIHTPDRLARGERLALMCAGCHAADGLLPLEGNDFLGGDAPPIGRFFAPNLTPTHLGEWTDGEIIRSIREGIHRSGRSLLVMPSSGFRHLSDDDVASIVAYLRSQPAIEPDTPPARLNILGAAMINLAPIFEAQSPIMEPVLAPAEGVTPEYGGYLASIACTGCHGEDLAGDVVVGAPGLLGVGLTWSDTAFVSFFETGIKPDGASVNGNLMPWEEIRRVFVDDDLRALLLHLRQRFGTGD